MTRPWTTSWPASSMPTGATERGAARGRHPAARGWRPDRSLVLRSLAERAAARGACWPRVAAAALLVRGIAGDDQPTFAARLGVTVADLARLERGAVPAAEVPAALRAVAGFVDWDWVAGATAGP